MPTDTEIHVHTNRCWWNLFEARWECAPAEPPLVDVRDMVVVHTALLREFRLAPAAVVRVPDGDRRRAGAVAEHLRLLCELLHHHHAGEDELLWPKLRDRVPAPRRAAIEAAEAQHEQIDAALAAVEAQREDWQRDAGADRGARLTDSLRHLHIVLSEHLELEERLLLPLAAVVLTPAEWHAIGEAAVAALPKPALVLAFGMFAYEGDPAVLRAMLQAAPAVPRVLLPRIAPRVYARRARKVHGTAAP